MFLFKVKKGLNLPINGKPDQKVYATGPVRRVALVAEDYVGMKPRMCVNVGDVVKRGQILFEDKKIPGIIYTSPGAGTVLSINRGERRALQTVVIELNDAEMAGTITDADEQSFESYTGNNIAALSDEQIKALLLESGLWTVLRARPFSKVADPSTSPHAIFVNAMDSNPLAGSPELAMPGNEDAFNTGLLCLVKLTPGKTYLCREPGSTISACPHSGIETYEFAGPHPAGTVGLHMNYISPVNRERIAWHVNYQDVIAIGKLITTGKLDFDRVVSLAGPCVRHPRVVKTRVGAFLDDLLEGELAESDVRVISGSVLSGRKAMGETHGYLGRYHLQISVIHEGCKRDFMGWMLPGMDKFSVLNLFISTLFKNKKFDFSTAQNGGKRAIVPVGVYEKVMPLKIMPTYLLRALIAGDLERAEELGCLELDEEDLALCTYVCPSKGDYGPILRSSLETIEKEG